MYFHDVLGQERIKGLLRKYVDKAQIPHALLFSGRSGSGTLPMALALAQYANCTNPTAEGDSCGECRSCHLYQELTHPDLFLCFPAGKEKPVKEERISFKKQSNTSKTAEASKTGDVRPGNVLFRELLLENPYVTEAAWNEQYQEQTDKNTYISVETVMDLIQDLELKSFLSGYKVCIIWMPEKMRDDAANKLLKTLEEPTPQTLFILVSEHPETLLPTIRSRVQEIYFPPLTDEEIVQDLLALSLTEEDARTIAYAAQGDYNLAHQLANGETNAAYLQEMQALYRNAFYRQYIELFKWGEELAKKGREEQKALILYFAYMLREIYILHLERPDICYLISEEREFAQKVSSYISDRSVTHLINEYSKILKLLDANANMRLAYTDLAILHSRVILPKEQKKSQQAISS